MKTELIDIEICACTIGKNEAPNQQERRPGYGLPVRDASLCDQP